MFWKLKFSKSKGHSVGMSGNLTMTAFSHLMCPVRIALITCNANVLTIFVLLQSCGRSKLCSSIIAISVSTWYDTTLKFMLLYYWSQWSLIGEAVLLKFMIIYIFELVNDEFSVSFIYVPYHHGEVYLLNWSLELTIFQIDSKLLISMVYSGIAGTEKYHKASSLLVLFPCCN